jgi:hypothetical protein
MGEWQPIETAPKDVEILVWSQYQDTAYLAICDDQQWWTPDWWPEKWTEWLYSPTHWMPLPEPPK